MDIKDIKVGDTVLIEAEVLEKNMVNCHIKTSAGVSGLVTYEEIKEVIRKPFNWDDAKAGMAFRCISPHRHDGVVYLVSKYNDLRSNGNHDKYAIVSSGYKAIISCELYSIPHHDLTRAPEHDIEVT